MTIPNSDVASSPVRAASDGRATVLLVDDHAPNLLALEAILAPLGHRLVRATSGEEALRQLLQNDFAVILLDVMMPGLDGLQTAALIKGREKSRNIPIIFVSALNRGPHELVDGYAHGAVDYLVKPIDPEILRAKVSVFVELFRSKEEIKRQAAALVAREEEGRGLRRTVAQALNARATAEASVESYRFLAESIPQQVWTATPDGALDYVNSVVLRYFDQSAEAVLGAGWQAVIHPEDLPACVERWTRSLTTGASYEVEFRLRRHDGVYRWHLGRALPMRDGEGRVLRWFGTNTDIDDRLAAEAALRDERAALRDSEERLRVALDAGQMGDWEWILAGGEITWSASLERMHGIPVGSFAGTLAASWSDLHPDDRERVIETISRSITTRAEHHLQYRIVRPDGVTRWLDAHGKLVVDEAGSPLRLVGVCSDVTERREADDKAQRLATEAAARLAAESAGEGFRQVLMSIADPFFILSADWRISYVNEEGAALLLRTREELIGNNIWELFPEAVGGTFYQEYQRARRQGVPVSFEEYFAPLDTWFEVKAYPTPDGRLSVHYRDVTPRRRADEVRAREARHNALRADVSLALARAESLREILQRSCVAMVKHLGVAFARVWTLNHETRELELQASAGLYTHIDGAHARVPVGKFKIGLIAEELEPHLTNDVAHDPRVGNPAWAKEQQMVAFAGYPLVSDGRCVGVLAMFSRSALSDDTLNALAAIADAVAQAIERKRAEAALKIRAEELARSNADLERFAYVASHDLQEPLRMVTSYTQLLARRYKGKLDSNADEFIAFAVDGVNRMQALINDLLSFSRVGTKGGAFAAVALDKPLAAALANLHAAVSESGAEITHDPLPTLNVDESQILQLFQNLVGNALKFRGAERPRVHVGVERVGDEQCLFVRDNGIGIEPEYFHRLFVLFQRLHTRSEYPGNGIGLAICKRIVERHGGRIWVESAAGAGTTFFFTLRGKQA